MLDDKDTLRLIEQYLEGSLSAEEEILFEEMRQTDAQFEAALQFQQKLMRSMNRVGDQLFLKRLQNLETQIQTERATKKTPSLSIKNLRDKVLEKGEQMLNDLIAAFLPVPEYEIALASTSRSHTLEVKYPKEGINCSDSILEFELKKGVNEKIQLAIEDNQQNTIHSQVIDKQIILFEVSVKSLNAGRYYWKLKTKNDLVMGSFFIRKDLMPS